MKALLTIVSLIILTFHILPANAQENAEVEMLKERIESLEADLESVKTDLALLKKILNSSKNNATPESPKTDPIPLESKWNGKLTTTSMGGETTWESKVVVVKRDLNQFTIDLKSDRNFQWEFDCELKDTSFKIVNVRRIRGLDGLDPNKLAPVAGITGKGRIINGKELRMDYLWPKSQLQPVDIRGRLRVTLESE